MAVVAERPANDALVGLRFPDLIGEPDGLGRSDIPPGGNDLEERFAAQSWAVQWGSFWSSSPPGTH